MERWYHDVDSKDWKKPSDVTRDFNTARTINNSRAIFEINHNDYRLIVEINYSKGWVFIKVIGTLAEYNKVDAETVTCLRVKNKDDEIKEIKNEKGLLDSLRTL